MDSDWGTGGFIEAVNDIKEYTKENQNRIENNDRPNIKCLICLDCYYHFDIDLTDYSDGTTL
jgi:hypothetical protein